MSPLLVCAKDSNGRSSAATQPTMILFTAGTALALNVILKSPPIFISPLRKTQRGVRNSQSSPAANGTKWDYFFQFGTSGDWGVINLQLRGITTEPTNTEYSF